MKRNVPTRVVQIVLITGCCALAQAAETGRYQALPLGAESVRSSPRTLILDSQEGHLWVWSEKELLTDEKGVRRYGAALVYQGKLRPGKTVGEVIEQP